MQLFDVVTNCWKLKLTNATLFHFDSWTVVKDIVKPASFAIVFSFTIWSRSTTFNLNHALVVTAPRLTLLN